MMAGRHRSKERRTARQLLGELFRDMKATPGFTLSMYGSVVLILLGIVATWLGI